MATTPPRPNPPRPQHTVNQPRAQETGRTMGETSHPLPSGSDQVLLTPGARPLPDFQLVKLLGRGGFGEVWRASGPGGIDVALKFVRLGEQTGAVELRSLELMKNVRHAHLLPLFGAWQRNQYLILAMELGDQTLLDRLQEALRENLPGIPVKELLEYADEAARGIDFLNEYRHPTAKGAGGGIQHKDIKPQNLLLVGGSVKVADFGLARLLEHSVSTATGSLTPAYAAPEFLGGQATRWSDQYSLAISYCQLRGGRLPFEGSPVQVMAGHMQMAPDLTMLPERERPAVARALAKKPEERWPNCRAFVEALATGKTVRGTREKPAPKFAPEIPPRRSRKWVAVAAVALLALAVPAAVLLAGLGRGQTADEGDRIAGIPSGSGLETSGGVKKEPPVPSPDDKVKAPSAPVEKAAVTASPALRLLVIDNVTVCPKQNQTLRVRLKRGKCEGPIRLRLENVPDGMRAYPMLVSRTATDGTVDLLIEERIVRESHTLRLVAESGDFRARQEFRLTVASARPAAERIAEAEKAVQRDPSDPVAYLNRGHVHRHLGDAAKALADYEQAVKLDPSCPACRFHRGSTYLSKKQSAEALADANEAIRLAPAYPRPYAIRGHVYMARKEYDQALAEYNAAIRLDPSYPYAYTSRGDVHRAKHAYDRAIADYTAAIKLDPNHALAHENRGLAHAARGDPARAVADYTEAIRIKPTASAYNDRGTAYRSLKAYARAFADYDDAIKLAPKYAGAYNNRANLYHDKGEYDRALADYDAAIKLAPRFALAYRNRGNVHRDKKHGDKALADYSEALRLNPNDDVALLSRGNLFHDVKRDYQKAIDDYTEILRLTPGSAVGYANRGNSHRARGEFARAIADLTAAIHLNPNYDYAFGVRGEVHRANKDQARALADFDEAIRLNPKNSRAFNNRGLTYRDKKEPEKALADYTEAIRLDPADSAPCYNRASILLTKKEWDRAIADLTQAIKLAPTYVPAFNDRGVAYVSRGEYDKAIADYTAAIRLDPNYTLAYRNRANAYEKKGDHERARQDRERAKAAKVVY